MKRLLLALVLVASVTAVAAPASAGPFVRRFYYAPYTVAYPAYYPTVTYYPAPVFRRPVVYGYRYAAPVVYPGVYPYGYYPY